MPVLMLGSVTRVAPGPARRPRARGPSLAAIASVSPSIAAADVPSPTSSPSSCECDRARGRSFSGPATFPAQRAEDTEVDEEVRLQPEGCLAVRARLPSHRRGSPLGTVVDPRSATSDGYGVDLATSPEAPIRGVCTLHMCEAPRRRARIRREGSRTSSRRGRLPSTSSASGTRPAPRRGAPPQRPQSVVRPSSERQDELDAGAKLDRSVTRDAGTARRGFEELDRLIEPPDALQREAPDCTRSRSDPAPPRRGAPPHARAGSQPPRSRTTGAHAARRPRVEPTPRARVRRGPPGRCASRAARSRCVPTSSSPSPRPSSQRANVSCIAARSGRPIAS